MGTHLSPASLASLASIISLPSLLTAVSIAPCAPAHPTLPSPLLLHRSLARASISLALPSFVDEQSVQAIGEPAAANAIAQMEYIAVTLPPHLASAPVNISFLSTRASPTEGEPILLLHGFDISCLEWRRLLPALEAAGMEAYAPCLLGWGFTDTSALSTVGVEAKREQLLAFWREQMGGRRMHVVAASLGACVALDLFAHEPDAFASLALLAPAIYTDAPPSLPPPVARFFIDNVIASPKVRPFSPSPLSPHLPAARCLA